MLLPDIMIDVANSDRVKVRFKLVREDGWPPVESEGLWAEPLGGDRFRIDNSPWFVPNIAAEDVVEAFADGDGVLWATHTISRGGRLAVQVIPLRAGPLQGDVQAVLDEFAALGVSGEGAAPAYPLVTLDISPDADLRAIVDRLRKGRTDGSWEFSEGCVTQEWLAL